MLDDATETVAVGSDDHVLAGLDLGGDDVVPVGQGAGDGVLQGLTGGQLAGLQPLVAPGLGWARGTHTSPRHQVGLLAGGRVTCLPHCVVLLCLIVVYISIPVAQSSLHLLPLKLLL